VNRLTIGWRTDWHYAGASCQPLNSEVIRNESDVDEKGMTYPKSFISYSWDDEDHKRWVRMLAENLQRNGVKVFLDQWDLHLGADLPQYMETCVRDVDYVLLVCTPSFALKANFGEGGVGYEKSVVTGEIFSGSHDARKFVPLLRTGSPQESLPSYLKSKVFIDFSDSRAFSSQLEELLRHIFGSPRHSPPSLGRKPNFISDKSTAENAFRATSRDMYCVRCGAVPGKATNCPGWTKHDFVMSKGPVYCARCGVVPGKATRCPGWTKHDFVASKGSVYCARCGTVPGEATNCPGWTKHDFVC